LNWS